MEIAGTISPTRSTASPSSPRRSRAVSSWRCRAPSWTLSANSAEQGTATEELSVSYGAEPVEIGFNSRYLLDMMQQVEGETAQFVFADSNSPTIVRDPADVGALYVIMPMRV